MTNSKTTLCPEVLSKLPLDVKVPQYERSKVTAGIFHFGVGGFHRSHQAFVMDNLFALGVAQDWGICGVGVLDAEKKMRDVLIDQKGLYTLVEKEASGNFSYQVIGSIINFLFAPDDVEEVIERLTSPAARIVSLTITQGGYNINPVTGEFDVNNIQDDIKNPHKPKTVFGIVIEALKIRKYRGMSGFTIMSCDNFQHNGVLTRRAFMGYAEAACPMLIPWMEKNVTFPNSMVDRITPKTTDLDRKTTAQKLGIVDAWPVVCEPFFQWVIEDNFIAGRPPYEKMGVQMVDDVEPYELMKHRLLNVGHQLITYFGLMLGYKLINEAAQDKQIVAFWKAYMDLEATDTLKPVPGIDLTAYKAKIVERFQNPHLHDTLERLADGGSGRIRKFVIPVIEDRLAKGKNIYLSTAILASFAACLDVSDEDGKPIAASEDRMKDRLAVLAKKLHTDPTAIISEVQIFGDIVKHKAFLHAFTEIYQKIRAEGSRETLAWLLTRA